MADETLIRLRDIDKTYQSGEVAVEVLRGVDLDVGPGEYISLVGRSGAGKSTLMNIIGCLDQPSGGEYLLAGRDVARLDDDELSLVRGATIGFVFQSFHLLSGRNAMENVELPMEYAGVEANARRERSVELLRKVGLGNRLDHSPRQLSGGERQRVAIARSLANRPRLVLADEPTGNLDSSARDRILELFEELLEENLTMVIVTHDSYVSDRTARCITLDDGQIVDDRVRP